MTIGYSSFGQCFATVNEAVDNFYASQNAIALIVGSTPYISVPAKVSGVWKYSLQNASTGAVSFTSTAAQTTVYGSCTLPESTGSGGTTTGTVSIVYPPVTYDYAAATAAWKFAVTIVVGTWMIAKNAGAIINAIKFW